jgi:hypothetical protein
MDAQLGVAEGARPHARRPAWRCTRLCRRGTSGVSLFAPQLRPPPAAPLARCTPTQHTHTHARTRTPDTTAV